MKLYVLKIVESTSVDGPGLRNSVYCSGCVNHCKGCHNPQSWDILAGKPCEVSEIAEKLLADDFCDVTFSGGDPMFQAEAFTELAKLIKSKSDKNIWCYTGYTLDEILADEAKVRLMENVDVVVEGRYIQELRNESLLFRGSSNQRLLDAKRTLEERKAVLYNYNPFPWWSELSSREGSFDNGKRALVI